MMSLFLDNGPCPINSIQKAVRYLAIYIFFLPSHSRLTIFFYKDRERYTEAIMATNSVEKY